jgi:hypothetical protein
MFGRGVFRPGCTRVSSFISFLRPDHRHMHVNARQLLSADNELIRFEFTVRNTPYARMKPRKVPSLPGTRRGRNRRHSLGTEELGFGVPALVEAPQMAT